MTTTYELYTNENGTPKAVEGKAPAIIERVEALEADVKTLDGDIGNIQTEIEVLEGGVVKTINGETPDQAGNIDIPVGHNVGEEWISYTGKIPNGGVPYCGQLVTREVYRDLWEYAQTQGLVKSESEWQSIASAQNGNVPYYSDGDGSSTFRMPKLVGYVKGASSQSESGTYTPEGLPNITGTLSSHNNSLASPTGFVYEIVQGSKGVAANWGGTFAQEVGFDASRSSAVYGNSDHVTPETSTVLFGVYAFGAIVETGALDATTLSNGLATLESEMVTYERILDNQGLYVVRYESGVQFCWGDATPASTGHLTVTFAMPFGDAPVVFTNSKGIVDSTCNSTAYLEEVSATHFKVYKIRGNASGQISDAGGFNWFAFGHWK